MQMTDKNIRHKIMPTVIFKNKNVFLFVPSKAFLKTVFIFSFIKVTFLTRILSEYVFS